MRRYKYLPLGISLVCLAVAGAVLLLTGFLLDYIYFLKEPEINAVIAWTDLGVSIAFVISAVIMLTSPDNVLARRTGAVLMAAVLVITSVNGWLFYRFSRGHCMDYVDSEWIDGVSVGDAEYLIANSDPDLIYIGKKDCAKCEKFEKKIEPTLDRYEVELTAYYLTKGRGDANEKKRSELIRKYSIDSVPCVLRIENGSVVERWDDPVRDIDEIKEAVKNEAL